MINNVLICFASTPVAIVFRDEIGLWCSSYRGTNFLSSYFIKVIISTFSLGIVNLKMSSAMERHHIELELTKIIDAENLNRKDAALTYNNRGHIRYLQVNFDGAIEDYDKALSIDPDLAVAYYNRGTVFYRLGMFQNALADMEQAVRLEGKNGEFMKGLTACLIKNKQVTVK